MGDWRGVFGIVDLFEKEKGRKEGRRIKEKKERKKN